MLSIAPAVKRICLLIVLGSGLAIACLQYKQPANCQQLCMERPCQVGKCLSREQQAGFPLPVVRDEPAGSSPTSSWGKVDSADYIAFNPGAFAFNVLFYSSFLCLAWRLIIFGKQLI